MRKLLIFAFTLLLASYSHNHNPQVMISTEIGNIETEIFLEKAPVTAGDYWNYQDYI